MRLYLKFWNVRVFCSQFAMLRQVKNMFVVRAIVCWFAKIHRNELHALDQIANESSIWPRVLSRHQFHRCLECIVSLVDIVRIHFWWVVWYLWVTSNTNHCSSLQFNTLNNALARCPHCRKVSSVGPEFARKRGILLLALAIFFLIAGLAITLTTYSYAKVNSLHFLQLFSVEF